MIEPARNHLVGFLLNALDHAETAQVEEALAADNSLRDELQRIRAHLPTLEHDREHHEPPPGLAARTCHWLTERLHELHPPQADPFDHPGGMAFSAAPRDAPHDAALLANFPAVPDESLANPAQAGPNSPSFASSNSHSNASSIAHSPSLALTNPADHVPTPASLSPAVWPAGSSWGDWRLRASDAIVVAGILLCASFLFVPALAHCQFAARTQACQNNLKQVGVALMSYSDQHGGLFPHVPTHGNRAFVGVIGAMLRDSEFLASPASLFCVATNRRTSAAIANYPTLAQIDNAAAPLLPAIRRAARGDYGFSVGYWDHGKLALLRNQHRPWYAIAADAPSDSLPSHATENHAGRGQSVLFEDGHYQFLRRCCPRMSRDELFLNHLGHVSPGVDANDSVILAGDVPLESLPPES